MSRACESCGHSESHEPRTANLSSGRCPKCGCLSGWQKPEAEMTPEVMDLFEALKDSVKARGKR